jgi:hypothetical protein
LLTVFPVTGGKVDSSSSAIEIAGLLLGMKAPAAQIFAAVTFIATKQSKEKLSSVDSITREVFDGCQCPFFKSEYTRQTAGL